MQLNKIDLYLPKGKDHDDKLRRMEKRLIGEQRQSVIECRNENKSEDTKLVQAKRNQNDLKERIEMLKSKLRKQAIEAQKLVDKANETGDFKLAVSIQE